MRVIYKKLPPKNKRYIATIGVFDGIHLGHRFILEKVKKESKKKNLSSLVITFDIPPQQFLSKDIFKHGHRIQKRFRGCINDFEQKIVLLEKLKIDCVWFLRTNHKLLELSAENFIGYICKYFKIEEFIVGEDFRFGYGGGKDASHFKKLALENNIKLQIIKKKTKYQKIISSSLIRELIKKGRLKEAHKFLGRNFSIKGRVVKGNGLGAGLGYPTANIFTFNYVIPASAVYAAWAAVGKKYYLSAVSIGTRPTVTKSKKIVMEVYLMNFHKNILGKSLKIIFLEKIRGEKKFSSKEFLRTAIKKDLKRITAKYGVSGRQTPQLLVS